MSALAIACLWCVMQVTLLSAVGIAISIIVARRYPLLAATSANAVIVMAIAATLLIPIRVPQWSLPKNQPADIQEQVTVNQTVTAINGRERHDSGGWSVNLHAFATQAISGIKHPNQHALFNGPAIGWITLILVAVVGVGIIRFVGAVCAVERIRRKSRHVDDVQANQKLHELAQAMACTTSVQLRVSDDVHSPAVLGWLRPLIVLPQQWTTWESFQLQAVLAHELAHVVRRDFFWQVLATFTQAFHFYHPLAHWLLGRLTYSQELAADQLAAETLGSRTMYSKALSQLAIRQDDFLLRFRAEPILLPTLTSHLIRRIKMLRAMECVEQSGLQRAIRVAASCTVVLLGVGTVALRGLAQPVEAPAEHDTAKPTISTTADERLFRGLPTDPTIVGDNELGLYSIKVTEILKNESVKPYLPLLNTAASEGWKNFFETDAAPTLHLEMIDFVVGPAEIKIKRLGKDSPIEQKNQVMFGSPYAVVRFHEDISPWKEWIRENAPAAKQMQSGDTVYFQLPVIPAIGPEPACIAARDSRTLVVFYKNENKELPNWASKDFQQSSTKWDQEWKSFDTGMISLLSSNHGIDPQLFVSEKPYVQALDQILNNVERIGYGVDWDDASSQMGVKIRFCCQDQQAAAAVDDAIVNFTKLKLEEAARRLTEIENSEEKDIAESPSNTPFATREDCLRAFDLLKNYQANTTLNTDGTVSVEVVAVLGYSLFDFVREFIQPPEKVATAPKEETTK